MILIVIVVALALQLAGYILIDRYDQARWLKTCVLVTALVCHIWLLPQIMIWWEYSANPGRSCGMAAMSIVLIFWILGVLPTLLEFWIYQTVVRRRLKKMS
jgi:hypothetical protein